VTAAGTHAQLARAQARIDAMPPPDDDGQIAQPPLQHIVCIPFAGALWTCAADRDGLYGARIDGQWFDITYALGERLAADLWAAWQGLED